MPQALAVERPGLVIHVPMDSETEAGIEHMFSLAPVE